MDLFQRADIMMKQLFIAGLGGFVGTAFRFLISRYFQLNLPTDFPWGTFAINILGSFLIGLFYGLSEKEDFMSPDLRLFLTVGICGGFTTFSTFSNESLTLLQNKDFLNLSLYVGLSFFLGIAAVYVGRQLVKAA
ncbi:MAG: crcB protein [Bacteroidetes bacterium]|nr:crcB protein [Bacteroidota bacterium]